jgi:hypothetical protein
LKKRGLARSMMLGKRIEMTQKKLPKREEKDGLVQKLKNRIRRLEKDNLRLKKENVTLEAYKNITNKYIDDELDGVPVEKVIRSVDRHHNLSDLKDEIQPACPQCVNPKLTILGRLDGVMHVCLKCGWKRMIKDEQ